MFEVRDKTAVYRGEIDAAEIALAVLTAKQAALEQDITSFVVAIPNEKWDVISEVTRLTSCKGIIDGDGDHGVTLTYEFTRTVTVTMSGAAPLLQTPSKTLDLAHRIVTSPTANGLESL